MVIQIPTPKTIPTRYYKIKNTAFDVVTDYHPYSF